MLCLRRPNHLFPNHCPCTAPNSHWCVTAPERLWPQDFSRGGDAHCGAFSPFPGAPYAICPAPGAPPGDPAAAACCRHLAFCVPYSRLGLAVEDRVSTVVVSPRLWAFAPEQWRGVLAHELGHAADFYLFGARYRLTTHAQPTLAAALQAIDAEADPELRADALGEVLVLAPAGVKLCYDPVFKIQATVPPAARCDGDGEGEGLMRHYTHAPLQGSVSKVRRR